MMTRLKRLPAAFYQTRAGHWPVQEWLRQLSKDDRTQIGESLAQVEFGWPVGMPVCRSLTGEKGLWEVRTSISAGRIARLIFCIYQGHAVILHGFVKKTQKTPARDLELARKRKREIEDHDET